jgi:hypothetical protein
LTKEQFAAKITGREYPFRMSEDEVTLASNNRFIVVRGESDDLCETEGADSDECGAPGRIAFSSSGKMIQEPDDDEQTVLNKFGFKWNANVAFTVDLLWCAEKGYSWTCKTDAPHATFEIIEDGDPFCRGLVIDLKELV